MSMNQHSFHEPSLEESPNDSNPMGLPPQMPLRNLDSEVENIETFFLLARTQPAQERDGLKELEAGFQEFVTTGDLKALRKPIELHLQPSDIRILRNIDLIQNELSHAPREISDYYQQLIQGTQPGPHDFHSSHDAQMPTEKIVDYTESYRLRYKLSLEGCEMDSLEQIEALCQHPDAVLGNGLHCLKFIGTNDQPLDLISTFPALIVAYSLIPQVPGQVKELEEKFNQDLGRWKTLSTRNQPDLSGLFEGAIGAAFAVKFFPKAANLYMPGNEVIPAGVANMYPFDPNVFAQLQSVAFDFFLQASSTIQEMYDQSPDLDATFENTVDDAFGASEDDQAAGEHDSSISMGSPVEDGMYYQMPDDDADDSWAPYMQPDVPLDPSQAAMGFFVGW
ncbi:hypothetical protein FGADI_637 [Fusarium gaditjirri]|uniref:Uncharacterized protein n=1 Tax=Fusarium gaditjirri TaxID=282569 RepID=A0A8H4TNE6_9HYPO|nr:hypothetical protein FGADI_637 [Fusarium gaditjirri]